MSIVSRFLSHTQYSLVKYPFKCTLPKENVTLKSGHIDQINSYDIGGSEKNGTYGNFLRFVGP